MLLKHIPIKDAIKVDKSEDFKEAKINIHASYRGGNMNHEMWIPLTIQVPMNFTPDDTLNYVKENYIETKRAELESKGYKNVDVNLFSITVSPDLDGSDRDEEYDYEL